MKKNFTININLSLLLLVLFTAVLVPAMSSAHTLKSSNTGSVAFSVSIPDEWAPSIIREEANNAVNFKFKKADGSLVFLFSINKVTEQTWVNIKEQLTNCKMLDHKNGSIYYCQCSNKSKLKGADAETYNKIYGNLESILKSVHITE